jgi:hypothetical protein
MTPFRRNLLPPLLALALAAALAACKSRSLPQADAQARTPPAAGAISFRRDIYPVLAKNCTTTEGCHGNQPTAAVDLDLRGPVAYSQLVGKDAEMRKGAVRVRPGEPKASFLVDKLTGALKPDEGNSMPINAETGEPFQTSPLPSGYIEKVLKPWILAGAPNN